MIQTNSTPPGLKQDGLFKNLKLYIILFAVWTLIIGLSLTISSGQVWRGEIYNRRKSGKYYWEQASISPVKDENNRIVNYVAVKEDISDKKELQQLKESVDRIMRHDLKANLNGIIDPPQVLLKPQKC